MPPVLDFVERAANGSLLSDGAINMQVLLPNVTGIIKEHGIRCN
jgi:hypothetical protein